jgi:transposase
MKEVWLGDEHKTSCRCCHCESNKGVCETFRLIRNPRPWKRHEQILRHGLVKCKTCSCLWNRDTNAAINILKIGESHINGLQRPSYLDRK